jgi:hypothetical protein
MVLASVRDTSLAAWMDLQPLLSDRQELVYLALKSHGPLMNIELASLLRWSINCVPYHL